MNVDVMHLICPSRKNFLMIVMVTSVVLMDLSIQHGLPLCLLILYANAKDYIVHPLLTTIQSRLIPGVLNSLASTVDILIPPSLIPLVYALSRITVVPVVFVKTLGVT